jgi:hypothetical protein
VLVVAAVGDAMPDVVEKSGGFEFDASLRGEMVERLEMIEKQHGEFANVFGVALIVFEATAEAAGAD